MPRERAIPGLPCRDLDELLAFYTALGFDVTFRQVRPNPFAAISRGDIELHAFGMPPVFDPANSYGGCVIVVQDTLALHAAFAAGLRATFGKVPVSGIPRMTRPRKKSGAGGGFTIVDPGGNWIRISSFTDDEREPVGRLAKVVATAARQGDSHGDEARAISVLENGLLRHADAPPVDTLPALAYLAELRQRTGDRAGAVEAIDRIRALELSSADCDLVATELAAVAEIAADLGI
jgi:catechol 2,3-dioxygenase-like lactoylglutathione lyase family enzyme